MPSTKRKAPAIELQRRVMARREASEELDLAFSIDEDETSEEDSDDTSSSKSQEDESESFEAEHPHDAALLSFGALAKAHSELTRPGKSKGGKIDKKNDDIWEDNEVAERRAGRKDHRGFNRSSKHAPTEISSKKAVSRKREVVPISKREYRDPRFEPITGIVDQSKVHKAYSFLDDYREDEMKELKDAIKAAKDESSKERLKKALMSMESKKKAQVRKRKEQEILDMHRKEEKEAVKQGKQPFYLKKSEQKKRLLLDQYGELKGKQLDRVIERRRKKVEGKEKKKMPYARRGVES